MPEELWTEVLHCIGGGDQNHPQEKEIQQGNMLKEVLQMAKKWRETKGKGGRER